MKSLHGWEGNEKALLRAKTAFQKEAGDNLPASFFHFFCFFSPQLLFLSYGFNKESIKGKNRKSLFNEIENNTYADVSLQRHTQ
jgi:hypothetical protein